MTPLGMETSLRVVRYRDLIAAPWKNGRGITREIVSVGEGTGTESGTRLAAGFDWRLSMAEVSQDAPFSSFPGVRRHFVVIVGDGLELLLPDGPRRLSVGDPAASFDGDEIASARPMGRRATDLNLMVGTVRLTGSLSFIDQPRFESRSANLVIVSLREATRVAVVDAAGVTSDFLLNRLDSLVLQGSEGWSVSHEVPREEEVDADQAAPWAVAASVQSPSHSR
jgi:environmental stress-induced protein Ves